MIMYTYFKTKNDNMAYLIITIKLSYVPSYKNIPNKKNIYSPIKHDIL